jgi:CBS domain-containing protein
MPIERLIKRPVQSLPPTASCADAARLMRDANVGSVVVTRDGRPLGIVTDRISVR